MTSKIYIYENNSYTEGGKEAGREITRGRLEIKLCIIFLSIKPSQDRGKRKLNLQQTVDSFHNFKMPAYGIINTQT